MVQGFVIWLTGLPSSGKTTLALSLASSYREQGLQVEVLDGDELRQGLSADLGFTARDRHEHAKRVVFISEMLARNGIVVIVPLISPYRQTRDFARSQLKHFVEVYVKCPVEECIRRDVKGLYAKAFKGEISQFTGVSDPYEEPESAEVTVETNVLSVDQCCHRILATTSEIEYMWVRSSEGYDSGDELASRDSAESPASNSKHRRSIGY